MDPNLNTALKEKEPVAPDINQGVNPNYVDPNLSHTKKSYLLENPGQVSGGEQEDFKTPTQLANSFARMIFEYVKGREEIFKTPSFSALDPETKNDIRQNVQGAIRFLGSSASDANKDAQQWIKGKLNLVGEAGISYEDGYLNIGPGVSKKEIMDFVKAKFAEEKANDSQNTVDLAEPVAPEPTIPTVQDVAPEPEPVINLNQTPADQVPDMAPQSNPNRVGIWQSPKPFSADDIVPPVKSAAVEDMSEIINKSANENKQSETPITKELDGKYPGDIKEWQELESLRNHLARLENQKNTTMGEMVNLDDFRANYKKKKEKLAAVLRESLTGVSEGPLNQEQQKLVNDTLFNELVVKENEACLKALKENRSETLKDKAKEALRTVAGLKAVSWYLKQNKWTKVAINTGLFGVAVGAGTFIGGGAALTAMGATAFRGARAASSVLGSGLGATIDKRGYKQIEQVNEEEKNKIEEIKNDEKLSLEEKSKQYAEVRENSDKERKWITKRKAMFMIGGGVLAGSAAGGLLNMYYGGTPGSTSALENKKGGSVEPRRIPRGTMRPDENVAKKGEIIDQTIKAPSSEEVAAAKTEIQEQVVKTQQTEITEPEAKPEVAETPKAAEVAEVPEALKMSFKTEDLVHEVKAGDSTWNILKEVLKHDERFKNLSGTGTPQEVADQIEAKQTRVLHEILAKSLKNHNEYNIGPNGEIKVGDTVNFSKLFVNPQELDEVIKDAENLKPTQISSIIESNRKIETWLKVNPDKKFDLDEIMSTKPKVSVIPKLDTAPTQISIDEDLERLKSISPEIPNEPPAQVDPSPMEIPKKQGLSTEEQKAAIQEDILLAKKRLGVLEGGKDRLRTMSSDTSVVAQTAEMNQMVEAAFKNEINSVYGESKLLGLKKIAGVDTKEWKTIARLPASKVLEYFRSPETSDLPKVALQELQLSEKHRKLVEHVAQLVEEAHKNSNAEFKPYDNGENIEEYIKRIGTFLIKRNLGAVNNLNKAA